jgi:hypothetical protein
MMMIQTASAIFYSGEVLKRDAVTVLVLGEYHGDTSPGSGKSIEQRKDLLSFSKKHNTFLIIEDTIGYIISQTTDPQILHKAYGMAEELKVAPISPTIGLSVICTEQNINNVSAECRPLVGNNPPLELQIEANKKFFNTLKTCFNNSLYHKYINDAEEEHDFYIKKLREKQSSRSLWKNMTSQAASAQDLSLNIKATDKLIELNTICELSKVLESKKHSVIIIAVGAAHVRNISNMIQNIFNFNVSLSRNISKPVLLHGPFKKVQAIKQKELPITQEYALDLPQFFDEALKAPILKSKL